MADAGATKFSNPIADDGVALDPTAEVPTNGDSKAMDRNFDDDVEVSNAPVSVGYGESTDTYSPRSQERVNAHHVQKFVGEQMFGEATLDDLDDDPDLEEHKSKCCGLLHPRTSVSQGYDFLQMMFLWYIVAMVPWRIAFEITTVFPEKLWVTDIVVDMAIVFDIGLNMQRYYFDPSTHRLITDSSVIRKEYLVTWAPIDVLSIFPFDFIVKQMAAAEEEVTVGSSTKLIRLARMARFARLFRLTKLANLRKFTRMINNSLRKIGMSKPGMEFLGRVLFLAGVVLLMTHVIACLWINLSRDDTIKRVNPLVQVTTLEGELVNVYDNWYAREYLIGDPDFCKENHPESPDKCDDDVWRTDQIPGFTAADRNAKIYSDAAYWILTTMSTVGFGDILPYNTGERVFCCLVIVTGTFVWAYIVGSFSSTLQNMDRDKNKYDEEMRSIKAMMRFHEVPMELAERMDAFFEYKFDTHTMFDDNKIMDALPNRIKSDFIIHRFRNVIEMIPFFRGCREDAVIEIVTRFKSFSVLPADYLFHIGDPYTELVVLTKGRMAMVSEKNGTEKMEAEYFPGAFFGENEFLGFGRERTATVRARTFAEVSTIHPDDMEPVLRIHVKLRRRLEKYAAMKKQMEEGLKDLGSAADVESMLSLKEGIEETWEEEGKELKEAWEKMEKNKNGMIARENIGSLADLLGRPLKEWELDNAMHVMDVDGSGYIDFDEFSAWWEKNDSQLKFSGRNPQEEHNTSMKMMVETSLGLMHDVMVRLDGLEAKVDALQKR